MSITIYSPDTYSDVINIGLPFMGGVRGGVLYRYRKRKRRPLIHLGIDVNLAVMTLDDDVVGDEHTETSTLANRLCGNGVVEESLENVIRYSAAVVAYGDDKVRVLYPCCNGDGRREVLAFA